MASHTVVVGGGVIGVATAYYLAQRGQNVTLVEQNELCSGCSQGNAGQITPGHLPLPQPEVLRRSLHFLLSSTSPLYIRPRVDVELFGWLWRFSRACTAQHLHKSTKILGDLGRASIQLFERLSSSLNFSYRNEGRLEVCRTPKNPPCCAARGCAVADSWIRIARAHRAGASRVRARRDRECGRSGVLSPLRSLQPAALRHGIGWCRDGLRGRVPTAHTCHRGELS